MDKQRLAEIVRRAQGGDAQAQRELYADSMDSVYFLARKILGNPDDAEDVTQEVFVAMLEKLPALEQPEAYYKWVNRITANKSYGYLRGNRPTPVDDDEIQEVLETEYNSEETPDLKYDNEETRRLVMEIIDALPDVQRVCVMLYYFDQLTVEEIAEETESNVHTVRSRLALARKRIQAAILEKEEREGIRLHAALPFILMRSFEEFETPEGLFTRIWDRVSEELATAARTAAEASRIVQEINTLADSSPEIAEAGGDSLMSSQSGDAAELSAQYQPEGWQAPQGVSELPLPSTPPAALSQGIGEATVKVGLSLGAKIAIAGVGIAAVVLGAVFVPPMLGNTEEPPALVEMAETEATMTEPTTETEPLRPAIPTLDASDIHFDFEAGSITLDATLPATLEINHPDFAQGSTEWIWGVLFSDGVTLYEVESSYLTQSNLLHEQAADSASVVLGTTVWNRVKGGGGSNVIIPIVHDTAAENFIWWIPDLGNVMIPQDNIKYIGFVTTETLGEPMYGSYKLVDGDWELLGYEPLYRYDEAFSGTPTETAAEPETEPVTEPATEAETVTETAPATEPETASTEGGTVTFAGVNGGTFAITNVIEESSTTMTLSLLEGGGEFTIPYFTVTVGAEIKAVDNVGEEFYMGYALGFADGANMRRGDSDSVDPYVGYAFSEGMQGDYTVGVAWSGGGYISYPAVAHITVQ